MRRRKKDFDFDFKLFLYIVIIPIMLIIWFCEMVGKQLKNLQYCCNNSINDNNLKKNSNHFKWIDGKTDELEVDEVNDIEELLEDDDLFDN